MPPLLKFLRLESSGGEKDIEIIDQSIRFAQSNQIDIVIISANDEVNTLIAESTTVDQSIYVCMPFEGKIFEKLKEKGYRIIGPQCVISCLLLEIPVPKRTYPVCNVSMLDTVVCCSSMKKEERMNIQQLVLLMGGDVTGDFTLAVTHLVAKEVGSKKYEVACSNNIASVYPSWVYSAWEKSKYDHFIATESNIIKEHLIPIFKGCTICVTGIDGTKRDAIKTIVQKNGGIYSGELNMKTCTHLLVEHPHGQKYTHARQWKLHCVSPLWLYDCLKKKHWISEKPYKVEPDSNVTVTSILQQSNIQNTILVANNDKSCSERLSKSKDKTEAKNKKCKFKVVSSQSIEISDLKFGIGNSYLEECKIYICNRPGPVFDVCKKIINNGGGIRLNILGDSVTHIIFWDQIPPDVDEFFNQITGNEGVFPHVVSPQWLVDSCKNDNMMPEYDYSIVEHPVLDKTYNEDIFVKPNAPVTKPTVTSSVLEQLDDLVADENSLLNQYLTVNHESTRISQFDIGEERGGKPIFDEVTQEDDTTIVLNDDYSSILEKKRVAIQRCEDSHVLQISSLIEEYGGVVADGEECDFIIVPLSHEDTVPYNPKEVTLCWLEHSIELQKLQDPKSSFLYQPFYLPGDARPLQNCVITISQYTGIERQHLFHLAELLGGIGQEYFVRNDTEAMKANTHLILAKPEGSKYEASIKWNVPCVRREWLFRCAEVRRRLPEEDFSMSHVKGNGGPPMVITIEETNAHAWDKKVSLPKSNEKSIVIAAPNNVTDNISPDFDSSGVTLTDADAKKEIKKLQGESLIPNIGEDVGTSFFSKLTEGTFETSEMEAAEKDASVKVSNDLVKSLLDDKETDENPADVTHDFSAFNAYIVNEKREASCNKENEAVNSVFPSSLPSDFDKSRFSFDFSDALDGFQSPLISSQDRRKSTNRRSRLSLPFDMQFTEALQKAVDRHCGTEDEVFNDTNGKSNKWENTDNNVLKNVVVVVSKKLSHSQSELHNLTSILGGEYRFYFDDSCTHFIYQGKINDTSKDFVEAKTKKKYLVSPHWLYACIEAKKRVSEDKYPVIYNPRMSINVTSDCQLKGQCNDDVYSNMVEKGKANIAESPKEMTDVQKKMKEIMNAAKAPKAERRARRQTTNVPGVKSDNSCHRKMRNRSSSQKNDSVQSSGSDPLVEKLCLDVGNEQSQGGFITYDDPTGRLERERILEHLKRASPSQDIESLNYPVEKLSSSVKDSKVDGSNGVGVNQDGKIMTENGQKRSLSPMKPQISLPITNASVVPDVVDLLYDKEADDELKKMQNAKKYRFIFSGMNAQEKIDYGATIEELGGVLFDVQYFNLQSTHLIVRAPSKNEKYLSTLASGHWALHKSFLDASREANDFVDEQNHEWGSQSNSSELALAARRWRIELTEKRLLDPKAAAFNGWVVLLCIEPSKQAGFKRILEAGGAELLALRPPFDVTDGATHAFIGDRKQLVKNKVDLRLLHNAGVWILKPEYIADYLILDPKPTTCEYVVEEVNAFEEQSDIPATNRKRKVMEGQKGSKKAKR